jgi:CBS domain-containing protein
MSDDLLATIDPYPFRHRTSELMTPDPVFVPAAISLHEAIACMTELEISSVLVGQDQSFDGPGIVTEHDALRAIAEGGGEALERPCGSVMSTPLFGVEADDFLHVAIGRMARLGVRHLVVKDKQGHICGIVTARSLVKHRSAHALIIGDELRSAETPEQLKAAHDRLVAMARALLDDHTRLSVIASVIAGFYRDLTQRTMELAEAEVGGGLPRYAVMILGSAGRGESLLAGDQDNAIVFEDGSDGGRLAEVAGRANDLLDAAGLPYCSGGVMASRPEWRRSLSDWRETVEGWARRADGASLLNVDIFLI